MRRKIRSFYKDEDDDWVAGLDCNHAQHVRHRPPFIKRPWTGSEAGRAAMLGTELDCIRCDRLEFPPGLHEYKRTPVFTEATLPAALRRDHKTKPGTWALIHIFTGRLRYTVRYPEERCIELQPGMAGIVAPEMEHCVEPVGSVRFCVAFYSSAAPVDTVR